MQIVISGSSGFVGEGLRQFFGQRGDEVTPLRIRETTSIAQISAILEGSDVVINLSGATIMGRWTPSYKALLRRSRLATTQKIVDALSINSHPPHTFLNASAVGIYDSFQSHTEESDHFAHDFLAALVQEWEACALQAQSPHTRVCCTRFGIVYGKEGGAMAKMLPLFRLGLGGKIGSGDQMISWVHRDDLVRVYAFIFDHPHLQGVVNVAAPYPLTNAAQTTIMGKVLRRPTWLTIPAWVVKLLFGEGSSVMLESKQVTSSRLEQEGFVFMYPTFDEAFKAIVSS